MKLNPSFKILFIIFMFAVAFPVSAEAKKDETPSSLTPLLGQEPMVRVSISGRRGGIKQIPLETYLAGVIGCEMSRTWPAEALKAQTIAARSYALSRILESRSAGMPYDVVDTQGDQVFRKSRMKDAYLSSIVQQTRGMILETKGKVVRAFYSSTCGGKSRTSKSAGLASEVPLTKIFTDSHCEISPFRSWRVSFTNQEIEKKFNNRGFSFANLRQVKVGKKDKSGYVTSLKFIDDRGATIVPAAKFRNILGYMNIKSLLFNLGQAGESVVVAGNGFGHGVGMCQYGAKDMADRGKGFQQILSKYYPRISVTKLY